MTNMNMFIPIERDDGNVPSHHWYQIANTSCTTNTWWVETTTGHRFQYAWLPPHERRWGCLNNCMFKTWDYAPIEEFMEVEPEKFLNWCQTITTSATYCNIQLQAQQILFDNQNVSGLWNYRANTAGYEFELHGGDYVLARDPNKPLPLLNHATDKTDVEIATERSEKLLAVWLTPDEHRAYKKNEAIEIQSHKNADIIYIVKKYNRVEIKKKSTDKVIAEACLVLRDARIVENDVLLTKILLLKSDEDKFLKTANLSDPRPVVQEHGWVCNECRETFVEEANINQHCVERHEGRISVSRPGYLRELHEILPELAAK